MKKAAGIFCGILLGVASLTPPAAKASSGVDFPDYRGRYKGTWTLGIDGLSGAAPIQGRIIAPANGSRMQVKFSGFLSASTLQAPILASFVLTKNHRVTGNTALMGLEGLIPTSPARFSESGKVLRFTAIIPSGTVIQGAPFAATVSYTLRFTKASLIITGQGIIGAGPPPWNFRIVLRRRGKS
jgi:hypothetical protein